MRRIHLLVLGLYACSGAEKAPVLALGALEGARSGVLFSSSGDVTTVTPIDPSHVTELDVPEASSLELWLFGCDKNTLAPPSSGTTFNAGSGSECGDDSAAPCPYRALGLELGVADTWREVTPGHEPWHMGSRPSPCAAFTPTIEVEIPELDPEATSLSFIARIGDDAVLVGAEDHRNGKRSAFRAWRIPSGPISSLGAPFATLTSTSPWIAGIAAGDGSVMVFGEGGIAGKVELAGDRLIVRQTELFATEHLECPDAEGFWLGVGAVEASGGMTPSGFEVWVSTPCRALYRKVGNGPFRMVRAPLATDTFNEDDMGLAFIGTGEVYAAGVLQSGMLHIKNGVSLQEDLGDHGRPSYTVHTTESGRVIGSAPDPNGIFIFERVDGRWQPLSETTAGSLYDVIGLGEGFLAGVGFGGAMMQFTATLRCEQQPLLPATHLAMRMTRVHDHYLTLLRTRPTASLVPRLAVFDAELRERCDQPAAVR